MKYWHHFISRNQTDGLLFSNIVMNCKWNDPWSCSNSYLSEAKSTIGTSSLSSELTVISFTDITVSSQESFDNDNIALPKKTYPRTIQKKNLIAKSGKAIKIPNQISSRKPSCYQIHFAECFIAHYIKVKLLKCVPKKIAEDHKLQSVCPTIYDVINEQKFAKSFSTAINILPKNIVNFSLSHIRSSTATDESEVFSEAIMDEQSQYDSENDEKRIRSKNMKKKIIQKYYETISKKTFVFNTFPEIFWNGSDNTCITAIMKWLKYMQSELLNESTYNFDKIIESIEREISAIESVCLPKELQIGELAAGECIQINDNNSTVIDTEEMFDQTLQILDNLITDIYRKGHKNESYF
ncbi:hypothetical protein X798_06899 [Onchocerca flexuosa]|uniref:Uncharacterized protein n=1 Tax=Onchocerca flexuosa TaxID=387005 RepID=A0A238BKZ1_9BILA|nr:hypothetical protein X798_06899 [Onchocerca flexuosa]